MSKYTPGLWILSQNLSGSENHRGFVIRDSDGFLIADVSPRDEDGIEGEANARLMVAAFDLLEALKSFAGVEDFKGWHPKYESAIEKARAAIAKATGEDV